MEKSSLGRWLISFVIVLFASSAIWAQKNQEDVVYLKNGSVIRGQVIEYNPQKNIKIEIYGGSILVYKSSEVIKIDKEKSQKPTVVTTDKRKMSHKPSGVGLYHTVAAATLMGIGDWGGPVPGMSLKTTTGWQFHRLIGVGGGIGVMGLGQYGFIPVFANIRGNFMKSSASLFYDINVGYGIGIASDAGGIFGGGAWGRMQTAQGGLYLRPSIGIRFSSKKRTHVFLDFGYVIQFANYEYLDRNNNPLSEKRTLYRPSLRVGIAF